MLNPYGMVSRQSARVCFLGRGALPIPTIKNEGVMNINDLQIFDFEGNEVRVLKKGDELWWVLKDVCDVLGLTNHRMVAARLEDYEKGVSLIDTLGGLQQMVVINEFGLYDTIFLSRKPKAKRFKKWVISEVLPSIRKTGSYSLQQLSPLEIMRNMLDTMIDHENKIKELQLKAEAHEEKVDKIQKAMSPLEKDESWRKWVNDTIRNISFKDNVYKSTWNRYYEELQERAHCNLSKRLNNLKTRAKMHGLAASKVQRLNNLDVIESDPRLKEIFTSIIKEFAVSNI